MLRLGLILLLSTLLLQKRSCAVLSGEGDETVDSNAEEWPVYMDGCYVAFLEDGMSNEDTDGFYQRVELQAKKGLNVTKMAEMRETSKAFVFMGDNSSAEEVSKMAGVRKVIPDYSVKGQSITWHLDRIDQRCRPRDRHNYLPDKNGTAVDIYVLDSGANFNYSDVKDRLIYPGIDFIDELNIKGHDAQRGSDCHGHGSHIISLAAGRKYGVAPGANVIVVRVLDCYNSGPFSAVLGGIELVLRMYRQRGNPAVASMSFLAIPSYDLDRAAYSLIREGISVVVAAGNYRKSACEFSPSRLSQSITVGATRELGDEVYWFDIWENSPGSNYGPCVDIFAPGQWIHSAGVNCNDCEVTRSGTSMSTPLVSGAVALLLQENPSFTPQQVKDKLLEMSTKSVINFTQLADRALAQNTPNRLLYVARRDGMEASCTPAEPETTSKSLMLPTSSPPSPSATQSRRGTPSTVSPSQSTSGSTAYPGTQILTPTPTTMPQTQSPPTSPPSSSKTPQPPSEAPSTPSEAPTPPSEAPTTPSKAPTTPSEAPTTPSEAPTSLPVTISPPTATTPPTQAALNALLCGTIISKDATGSCVAQPLDSHSPIVYDSLPKDKVAEYQHTLRGRGYTLTYLASSRIGHYAESRYIAIFEQKNYPNSITRLKMSIKDIVFDAIRLRAVHKYYLKDFVPAHERDSNGVDTTVFSGIFVKDPNIRTQMFAINSASYVMNYVHRRNGSVGLHSNWEVQLVSSNQMTNSDVMFCAVVQFVVNPHKKFALVGVTLAEARHAINEFHRQGQYLESFQSYWHSETTMRYNLVFTTKTMGSCNYKVIMDTDRPMMKKNRKVLIADGWVPTLVSSYLSPNRKSLKYITVWWK